MIGNIFRQIIDEELNDFWVILTVTIPYDVSMSYT